MYVLTVLRLMPVRFDSSYYQISDGERLVRPIYCPTVWPSQASKRRTLDQRNLFHDALSWIKSSLGSYEQDA